MTAPARPWMRRISRLAACFSSYHSASGWVQIGLYRCIYTRGFIWGWFSARFQSSNSCWFFLGGKFYNKKCLQEQFLFITILQDFAEQNHPAQGGKKLSVWIFPLVRLVNLSICKCYRKCYHTSPPSCIVLSLIRLRNTCASALNFSQVMTDADCEPPSTRTKVEISWWFPISCILFLASTSPVASSDLSGMHVEQQGRGGQVVFDARSTPKRHRTLGAIFLSWLFEYHRTYFTCQFQSTHIWLGRNVVQFSFLGVRKMP